MSSRITWCLIIITSVIPFIHTSDVKRGAPPPASVPRGHLPLGLVKLHPPANLTAGYIGKSNIYIFWYEPENYHLSIPFNLNITINATGNHLKPDINMTNQSKDSASPAYHVVTSKPETSTKSAKNLSIGDWMGHEWVPFHQAHLMEYVVHWKENGSATNNTKLLPANETELHLKGLNPGTTYQITVIATYASMTVMRSNDLYVTTLEAQNGTVDPNCQCDPYGVKDAKMCHYSLESSVGSTLHFCVCKPEYAGSFCERCQSTYFRTAKDHPCYECPCKETVSSGICEFNEDKLTCSHCKVGYAGSHCEKCASGYFRLYSDKQCQKCYCSGKSEFCDPRSGFCRFCKDNTTGYSCDRCLPNFIGDPRKNQPCIHKDKIKATSIHTGGIVAGVCIGLLVLIGGIVGFVLYRRWNKFPNVNKFWTVELKDDHERVNFSALPEDEIQARRMDYDFYQDQGGTRSRDGSQKYSHLQEI